jgi:DNA repair protein RecO
MTTEDHITTEGIVLRTIDVKDNDRIVILFTRELGIVKIYASKIKSKQNPAAVASTPLVASEWILRKAREDLYFHTEVSILTQNLQLRSNIDALQAACDLLKATEKGLAPEDPAPEVYDLLQFLLECLPNAASPSSIKAVYLAKLLLYQGLLGEGDSLGLQGLADLRSIEALMKMSLPPEAESEVVAAFEERFSSM